MVGRMIKKIGVIIAAIAFSVSPFSGANAQTVTAGYHEIVVVTADSEQLQTTFEEVGAWQAIGSGEVDSKWLKMWNVTSAAKYTLLANPGSTRGFVRLIEFEDDVGKLIRPNDQAWDTGGIFDFNMRIADMDAARTALMDRGWSSFSDPVEFSFGPFVVKEWLPRGPDSVRVAVIERVKPTLEGWPNLKKFSRAFNATMLVADITEARRFWREGLGFTSYLEHKSGSKEAGPNVLGIPHNMATSVVRDVSILHPQGVNEGSIELLAYEGATGHDFSDRTAMPNRGLARLRFPVEGLAALVAKLRAMGFAVSDISKDVPLSGVGRVNIAEATAPGGSKIDLYEIVVD